MNFFHELEEYILSDDDHRRRVAERNEARQGNREMTWRPQSQNPRNINNVENPQPDQNNRPSTRGGFAPRGRGRGPPRLMNHNQRDPYFYWQYHRRGHSTEGCPKTKKNIARIQQEKAMMSITSSMPNQLRSNFWQPHFMNSQPNPVPMQQFQQPQPLWQPSQQFYPQSQAIQSIQQPHPIREILPPPPDSSSRPEPSSRPQNSKALPSFGTIMPITGGSAMEFETKKQRNNYFRSVNTIIDDGPAARPEWDKVPITFTEEDFKLKLANHNDAMVIEVNIAGWVIEKILVDNGSSADILFFKTFKKMNLSQHMLHPSEYPLQGFGGKPIKPVGKVSLPVSFGDLTMPEQRPSPLMWLIFIIHISRFSVEVS
jgi:hypothetical protein